MPPELWLSSVVSAAAVVAVVFAIRTIGCPVGKAITIFAIVAVILSCCAFDYTWLVVDAGFRVATLGTRPCTKTLDASWVPFGVGSYNRIGFRGEMGAYELNYRQRCDVRLMV